MEAGGIRPTCVGMNRKRKTLPKSAPDIRPTCVGMNRLCLSSAPSRLNPPHVRGDEPC